VDWANSCVLGVKDGAILTLVLTGNFDVLQLRFRDYQLDPDGFELSRAGHRLRLEPRAITPEGVNGLFLNVNHTDYVCTQDSVGTVKLCPVGEGETKQVTGVAETDQILGSATESEYLYVDNSTSGLQG
jgi:hypothetical protein